MACQSLCLKFPQDCHHWGERIAGIVFWNWWWNAFGTSRHGKGLFFPCINIPIALESLTPYNLSLVEDGSMHWTPSKQKLISDLHSKLNMIIHNVLLRWMVSKAFRVSGKPWIQSFQGKIHRAIQFDQKAQTKTFIDTFVNGHSEAKWRVKKKSIS